MNFAFSAKGIRLANIAHNMIHSFFATGIAAVNDFVIGIIHHGPNEVVESSINRNKGYRRGIFYNIGAGN